MEPRGIVLLVGHQCRTSNQELNKLEAYSKSCETSKMEPFLKIVNGFYLLTIFAKPSILGVWQGSEYAPTKLYIPGNERKG